MADIVVLFRAPDIHSQVKLTFPLLTVAAVATFERCCQSGHVLCACYRTEGIHVTRLSIMSGVLDSVNMP